MTESDRAVAEHLLSDGGTVSPQEAADRTGYSYRTLRRVIDRMEGFIDHSYGELSIGSDYMAQEMLERMRASAKNFKHAVETGAMEVADAANDRVRSAWDEWRRQYNVTVRDGGDTARKVLKIGYRVEDRENAQYVLREAVTAYRGSHDDPAGVTGIKAVINYADGSKEVIRKLREFAFRKSSTVQRRSARDIMEEEHGTSDPEEIRSLRGDSSTD